MKPALLLAVSWLLSAPAHAVPLLVDRGDHPDGWSIEYGREFPGALGDLSIVDDAERGKCVQVTYDFSAGGHYTGAMWNGRLAAAESITFAVKMSPKGSGMVRFRDVTDQEFLGGFSVTPGEWTEIELPVDAEHFRQHWGGANDGEIHFPLKRILIAANKATTKGELRLADLAVGVAQPTAAETWQLRLLPPPPSGIVFASEPAPLTIRVQNRLQTERTARVEVTARTDRGVELEATPQVKLPGWTSADVAFPLPTKGFGYRAVEAVLKAGDTVVGEAESGYAVVPKPRTYGQASPDSYFGLQFITDYEAAERLGCKAIRLATGWEYLRLSNGEYQWEALDHAFASAKEHHFDVLYTLYVHAPAEFGWDNPEHPKAKKLVDPKHWGAFADFVTRIVTRYGDQITALEVQNEPDLTCWQQIGLELDDAVTYYAKMMQVARDAAHRVDPKMIIAGLDVSGGDLERGLKFSRGVMEHGGAAQLDLYTGHPYASPRYFGTGLKPKWPEVNQMAEKCTAALDLMTEFGRPRRMWVGELGWALSIKEPALSSASFDFAACITRALILGHTVPEVEKFLYFTLRGANERGHEYGLLRGMPLAPLPAASYYATCAAQLDLSRPAGPVDLGPTARCHRFDRNDGRTVFALWSLDEPLRLDTDLPSSVATACDAQGRPVESSDKLSLELTLGPCYLNVLTKQADQVAKVLAATPLTAPQPVTVRLVRLATAGTVAVDLMVHGNQPLESTVTMGGATAKETLQPGAQTVRLKLPAAALPGRELKQTVTVLASGVTQSAKLELTPLALPHLAQVKVDGKLDELPANAQFAVKDRGSILPPDPTVGWDGPADLSFTGGFGWTVEGLYVGLRVTDDEQVSQPKGGGAFWGYDSLQLAIDRDADSTVGFKPGDCEFGLALTASGPRGWVTFPSWQGLKCPLSITRTGTATVYEALLPWADLGLQPPEAGQVVALNVIANENDGQGRAYWMGLTPGIGEGKVPEVYRRFIAE